MEKVGGIPTQKSSPSKSCEGGSGNSFKELVPYPLFSALVRANVRYVLCGEKRFYTKSHGQGGRREGGFPMLGGDTIV